MNQIFDMYMLTFKVNIFIFTKLTKGGIVLP